MGKIIPIALAVILAAVMIPVMANLIGGTRELDCVNATYPTYNATADVCFDGTNMSQGNVTRDYPTDSLSATEYTLLGTATLFIVVALVYAVVRKTGLQPK